MDRRLGGRDRLGSRLGVRRERRRAGDGGARATADGAGAAVSAWIRRPSRAVVRDRRPGRGRRARPSPNRPPLSPSTLRSTPREGVAGGGARSRGSSRAGGIDRERDHARATIVTRGIARSRAGDRSRPGERPRARGPERRNPGLPGSLWRIDKTKWQRTSPESGGRRRARAERGAHLIGGARSTRRV